MAIAPEPFHHACLEVLRHAVVQTRARANTRYPHDQLAAFMDAVHNIPEEVEKWTPESEDRVRGWLGHFDRRWGRELGSLSKVFDEALAAAAVKHNPPMQRTGAAGIFSGVRKWFGRGSDR